MAVTVVVRWCVAAALVVRGAGGRILEPDPPPFASPWSTEALEWTTPDNVTIQHFGPPPLQPLVLPAPRPLLLRVYNDGDGDGCTDPNRNPGVTVPWWAEMRRHVPTERAMALGQIAAGDVARLGVPLAWNGTLHHGCSILLFVPVGSHGEDVRVAPPSTAGFVKWVYAQMRIQCSVENRFKDRRIRLYWVDDTMNAVEVVVAEPGAGVGQNTMIGHVYVARDYDTRVLVDWWAMDGRNVHVLTDQAQALRDACDQDTQKVCVDAEQALFSFLYEASFTKRHALNTCQPRVVRNYTDVGFLKLPVPTQTYDWLLRWYHEHARSEQVESSAGAVGTQHEAPWYVRHVPGSLKARLADTLRPMLAEWSGFAANELELTSCYGIRRYSRGAKLRMHVDTALTHVVSVIINIDQQGVDKDWPLEIKAHDGNYSYVTMQPGHMLFYESAKCLHGRPAPFEGDSYANLFLHFKPTSPGAWEYDFY